jgi:hypothetical protein
MAFLARARHRRSDVGQPGTPRPFDLLYTMHEPMRLPHHLFERLANPILVTVIGLALLKIAHGGGDGAG